MKCSALRAIEVFHFCQMTHKVSFFGIFFLNLFWSFFLAILAIQPFLKRDQI